MSIKPATGNSSAHATNKQNERGSGSKYSPFKSPPAPGGMVQGNKWKSRVNQNPPNVAEAKNTAPKVHMAPKINAGTDGQKDGAKRVINSEASPSNKKNTFRAPRGSGGGSVTDLGYTRLGKA
jgi:hypothetical protein